MGSWAEANCGVTPGGARGAGGIEGGMSNGEPIVLRAAMKPIPTLGAGLKTVNIATKETATALSERSDICAVPAAAVIGEAVVALELAKAVLEKFGGDSVVEFKRNVQGYLEQIRGHETNSSTTEN
jgi:chorismate synthase